nr:uncharacterized protein LOC127308996 [Lolium perenne]
MHESLNPTSLRPLSSTPRRGGGGHPPSPPHHRHIPFPTPQQEMMVAKFLLPAAKSPSPHPLDPLLPPGSLSPRAHQIWSQKTILGVPRLGRPPQVLVPSSNAGSRILVLSKLGEAHRCSAASALPPPSSPPRASTTKG